MRHVLIAAGIVFIAGCAAQEAESGTLKNVKWGMTSTEVIRALDGRARAQTGLPDENGQLGVVSVEDVNGQTMPVGFFFRDGKLVSYRVEFEDGYEQCQAKRSELDGLYGDSFYKSGGPDSGWTNSVWYEPALPGQVQLLAIGDQADASCRLTFMDEMAPNARDAQGLTRHQGAPTPRPDYRPYRPG